MRDFTKSIIPKNRHSVLIKTFLLLTVAICLPVSAAGLFAIKQSTDHSLKQISQFNDKILDEKTKYFEQKINDIDQLIYQYMFNEDIWHLMEAPQLTDKESFMMADILKKFRSMLSSNNEIQSIYFFDSTKKYVLSDTKYTQANFADQDILRQAFHMKKTSMIVSRQLQDGPVVTVIRSFTLPYQSRQGYFAVNLSLETFFQNLHNYESLILNADNQVLFAHDVPLDRLDAEQLQTHSLLHLDRDTYFVSGQTSDHLGWKLYFIQDYNGLVHPIDLLRNLMLISLGIVFVCSLLLAFLFANVLYRPVAHLVTKTKVFMKTNRGSGIQNEYQMIDYAMQQMQIRNNQISDKYEIALPFFQKYSLHDTLSKELWGTDKFLTICDALGFPLSHPHFVIAAFDCEDGHSPEDIEDAYSRFPSLQSEGLDAIFFEIDRCRGAFIINTAFEFDNICSSLTRFKTFLNDNHMELTLSLSDSFDDLSQFPEKYRHVLNQLDRKFFIGKNEIIYHDFQAVPAEPMSPDNKQMEQLMKSIQEQNFTRAAQLFEHVTATFITNEEPIDYIKYIHFQVCSQVISVLTEFNIDLQDSQIGKKQIFEEIQESKTIDQLKKTVLALFEKSGKLLESLKVKQHSEFVRLTLEYIETNYRSNLSLEEIAQKVYLSPRYLGTLFKSHTGMTIFDFITQLRMKHAEQLLLSTDMKIQDIAVSAGYNTVQSFLRLFKKYFHLSPNDYRKKHLRTDN